MSDFDAILFDMDGTLVDSEPYHTLAWTELLRSFGHTPDSDRWLDQFIGEPDSKTEESILRMYPDLVGRGGILEMKQRMFRDLITERGDELAMPGALRRLEALAARGVPMAVATNGVLVNCRAVLGAAGLLRFFDVLSTFDQVERGKPAPDIYLAAAERLGRAPERCVVVEDSIPGAAAGRAAGCFVACVRTMPVEQDFGSLADAVFPDTAEAMDWILSVTG